MPRRKITDGERSLLRMVYEETLPYPKLEVATNDYNIGGKTNSLTPEDVPYLSTTIWCADFSGPSVPKGDQGTFIHEFMHVWQHYHGVHKLLSAAWQYARHLGDYDEAYWYDLADSNDLTDYNLEQQAAIIEDFWRINSGLGTLRNKGTINSPEAYYRYAEQVRSAGPPHTPWGQRMEWVGPNVK
jgi:hypothetical protein